MKDNIGLPRMETAQLDMFDRFPQADPRNKVDISNPWCPGCMCIPCTCKRKEEFIRLGDVEGLTKFFAQSKYQVVSERCIQEGVVRVKFKGTRNECIKYMEINNDVDLMFKGRLVSWVIK